ncbi:hypothetical protein [Microbispora catharanthi]|uniref:hypothetical protein n=1 Tax=Microbispora catharanthi TaxID=1712871 RepID=UPI001F0FA18B|nr:hypothetical protein [Microbispora catharanthi]
MTVACCAPLGRAPLSESEAAELAPLFKAVADPVLLRLLSLIACHEGGETCVIGVDVHGALQRRSTVTGA